MARPETRKKSAKVKRTMIEPVGPKTGAKGRRSAKVRKAEHDEKVKRRKAATAAAVRGAAPVVPAVEVDAALAAEIEAIKADDVRKGRYYKRKGTDV